MGDSSDALRSIRNVIIVSQTEPRIQNLSWAVSMNKVIHQPNERGSLTMPVTNTDLRLGRWLTRWTTSWGGAEDGGSGGIYNHP